MNDSRLRPDGDRLFTVAEAARYVCGSDDYVRGLIATRLLPAVRRTPRKTRIRERDLYEFLHGRST